MPFMSASSFQADHRHGHHLIFFKSLTGTWCLVGQGSFQHVDNLMEKQIQCDCKKAGGQSNKESKNVSCMMIQNEKIVRQE